MTATVSNCAQASCATDQLHYYINYDKAYPSHNYQLTDTCIHCLSMLETSSFTLPQPQPQIGYSYETVWETHKSEYFVEMGWMDTLGIKPCNHSTSVNDESHAAILFAFFCVISSPIYRLMFPLFPFTFWPFPPFFTLFFKGPRVRRSCLAAIVQVYGVCGCGHSYRTLLQLYVHCETFLSTLLSLTSTDRFCLILTFCGTFSFQTCRLKSCSPEYELGSKSNRSRLIHHLLHSMSQKSFWYVKPVVMVYMLVVYSLCNLQYRS